MASDHCNLRCFLVRCVVYCMVFCDTALGILAFGVSEIQPIQILGVLSIFLGLLLLLGETMKNANCVLLYLGIKVVILIIYTYLCLLVIFAYLHSFKVNIKWMASVMSSLIILWFIQYTIYLFYKDLYESRNANNIENDNVTAV